MWIDCRFEENIDIELKYQIDDNYLMVECISRDFNLKLSKLYIVYSSGKIFEAASINDNDKRMKITLQYSVKYLKSLYINIDIAHFVLVLENDRKCVAYPVKNNEWENDPSVIRARELIDSVKANKSEAMECIDNIHSKIQSYPSYDFPVLNEFKWYYIEDFRENFELSALEYIKGTTSFKRHIQSGEGWFFGFSEDERLYALAVKTNKQNPISNADDCVIHFADREKKENIYAIGILLLDDGQYFCRLD